jgi:hypothetical protein
MLKKTQTVIKTESNSETDRLVKDLIDSDLLRFTIQFFYKTENGLRPFGTGVLAFIHDIHFILTASHVADYLIEDSNQLFIRVDKKKYINVIGDVKYTDIDITLFSSIRPYFCQKKRRMIERELYLCKAFVSIAPIVQLRCFF